MNFTQAWILTIAIETVLLLLLLRKKYQLGLIIGNSAIASTLTLPFVWFVFPMLGLPWMVQTAISEFFAFSAEALLYTWLFPRLGIQNACFVSFACNFLSFSAGLLFL